MKRCRHCGRTRANRPRGLCWTCYYQLDVRSRYPSESKFARRGEEDFYGSAQLPMAPTSALPGTPEKIAILTQRAQARHALWHPSDATFAGSMQAPQLAEVG